MNIKALFFSSLPSECIHHFWPRLSDQFKDLHLLQVSQADRVRKQQLLRDFEDDEITEIRTVHTFLKAKQNNNYYKTLKMIKLPKFGLSIHILESQTEQQLLRDFDDDEITEIRTIHSHF